MKSVACNPYLPLYEYVPNGEPRVFDERFYIYGSHDTSGGDWLCPEDYVVWSAPVDDLSQWRCEGISYQREQDPHSVDGKWELFAPDVIKGLDGRYYLFYYPRMQQEFGATASENPVGPFAFHGHIHYSDGSTLRENMPYDPTVLVDDDERIYLYYGYMSEVTAAELGVTVSPGCMVVGLKPDTVTVAGASNICLPRNIHTEGTGFENHGCYEGPSIREMNGRYYLVFSSEVCHELCYAVSDRPRDGFVYGGMIVSNGDIGIHGRQYPVRLPGSNRGGLVCIKGQYYMFYQRYIQRTRFSRQGCAELVSILPDGGISQVEMTSSGLNGGPLSAKGVWPAAYACHLTCVDGEKMLRHREADPMVLPPIRKEATTTGEEAGSSYIHNITDGTMIGFKYFQTDSVGRIALVLRGMCSERFVLYSGEVTKERVLAAVFVEAESVEWQKASVLVTWDGVHALYLRYQEEGSVDLKELEFGEQEK